MDSPKHVVKSDDVTVNDEEKKEKTVVSLLLAYKEIEDKCRVANWAALH